MLFLFIPKAQRILDQIYVYPELSKLSFQKTIVKTIYVIISNLLFTSGGHRCSSQPLGPLSAMLL